jgi:hypothetical protein
VGKIIYTSRSKGVTRQECKRMLYLGYEWAGKGLQRESGALPLLTGTAIHAAHARLFAGDEIESVISSTLVNYYAELFRGRDRKDPLLTALYREQAHMLSGMIRTWAYHRLPLILEEFEIARIEGMPFIEYEFPYEIAPGIIEQMRLDAVLRRKSTGELVIWDFKTLAYPSEDWAKKFEHDPQTYLYPLALEEFMKEPVEGIAYEGLVKGQRKKDTAKKSPFYGKTIQQSPYCYGYRLDAGGVFMYQTPYTATKGWEKIAVADEMTPKEWFDQVLVTENHRNGLFNDLFCIVPPIKAVGWEVERWKRQTIYAEYLDQRYIEEINEAMERGDCSLGEQLMDIYFPTNEQRCFKYGLDNACQFADPLGGICFNSSIAEAPFANGYVFREPHHELEKAA